MTLKYNIKTFITFLQEQHGKSYNGLDDNMPDAFEEWMGELSFEELLEYANTAYNEGISVERILRIY